VRRFRAAFGIHRTAPASRCSSCASRAAVR
jgi:hypothetical protein